MPILKLLAFTSLRWLLLLLLLLRLGSCMRIVHPCTQIMTRSVVCLGTNRSLHWS